MVKTNQAKNSSSLITSLFLMGLLLGFVALANVEETGLPGGETFRKRLQNLTTTTMQRYPSLQTVAVKGEATTTIPVNPKSTLQNDLVGIHHDPGRARLRVLLHKDARCPDPVLRGRLSGPALSLVHWEYTNTTTTDVVDSIEDETNSTSDPPTVSKIVVTGTYKVPVAGTYFLEIIVLLCHRWGPDQPMDTFDYRKISLEDPRYHRLTNKNASVVVPSTSQALTHSWNNFWVHQALVETPKTTPSNNTTNSSQPASVELSWEPVFTRFQPQHCRKPPNPEYVVKWCQGGPTDLTRFAPYHFMLPNETGLLEKIRQTSHALQKQQQTTTCSYSSRYTKLCLIGFSHSRTLAEHFPRDLPVAWGQAHYPEDVTVAFLQKTIPTLKCESLVIGLAQWPASYKRGGDLWHRFEAGMKQLLENIRTLPRRPRVFLRSVHENPLGYKINRSPPVDWRSPPVMHRFNQILRRLAREASMSPTETTTTDCDDNRMEVHFIDTSHIMHPVWDSAKDWCHYDNEASDKEALYIAAKVYGVL